MLSLLYGSTQWTTPGLQVPDIEFEDIIALCEEWRCKARCRTDKPYAGWISPMLLHANASRRRLVDVRGMAPWIGLDADHANWSLPDIIRYFAHKACIIYSTTNSTDDEKRWRIITQLSREVTCAEFTGVWRAFNLLLDEQVDIRTRNVNRLHYLPAQWIGGNNEWHWQMGNAWDVDALLAVCPAEEPVAYEEVYELAGQLRPDGTEIITAAMIDKHMNATAGGRFFRLLCAAATMHKANGWNLDATELANAALQVSAVDSNGVKRAFSALREAERAISYIESRVDTQTASERNMNRIRWKAGLPPFKKSAKVF